MYRKIIFAGLLAVALSAQAGTFTLLHSFSDTNSDGANPAGLVLINGVLYGVTAQGGIADNGQVFTLGTNGANYTPLYNFTGYPHDGSEPNELLPIGNTFYATTYGGGSNSFLGTLFKVDTNGQNYASLHTFDVDDGPHIPLGGLVVSGQTLYGTTLSGGAAGPGTVFKIDLNGSNVTVLHDFTDAPDGDEPSGRLVLAGATLYGITDEGGANDDGCIYKVDTNGANYAVLYDFSDPPDASSPVTGLSLSGNTLYGVTTVGGISNCGTVFSIDTNGNNFTILHNFSGPDGLSPQSPLLLANGWMYGATGYGGTSNAGTIFALTANGANFNVLKNFTNSFTGSGPVGTFATDGNTLYGVAYNGGPTNYGTVYRFLLSPVLTAQPQSVLATNGNNVTFGVSASDENPLIYQWYFNTNTLLAGQTTSVLNLNGITATNAGVYTVVVSNYTTAVTSAPALLTVISPPLITLQPLDATVTNGSSITFTSAAAGPGTLAYQWFYQTNVLVFGATGTSLTLPTANQGGYFTMKVTNSYGAATSTPALLTVTGRPLVLSSMFDPASGNFAFSYANLAGSTNRLLATTNLLDPNGWKAIATNLMVTNGTWQITDTNAAQTNRLRFYRFVSP